MKTAVRVCAALLALGAVSVHAADLCDGQPCSVSIDFSSGGVIATDHVATITFGSGGALVLGEGGAITPGEGGSITPAPAEGQAPDMSGGGSLILGPGGQIQFGPGGSLATGDAGAISFADGELGVQHAKAIDIHSDASIHVGDITSDGKVDLSATGDVDGCDSSTPLHLSAIEKDPETRITITSGANLSLGTFKGNPEVTVTSGGAVTLCSESTYFPSDSGDAGGGGSSGGSICIYTNGAENCSDYSSWSPAQVDGAAVMMLSTEPVRKGSGGSPAPGSLLLLGVVAVLRRVRPNR